MGQIRQTIPDDLHRALKARAAREGVTVKALLVRLLAEAMQDEDAHDGEKS